ncbi:MAG: hypothetical protein K0R82_2474 [Flavipsychrobacter sp.]|jgi:hypothetical protein|nr:hypothetical protein [Flavipsychrobacter sp.]
MSEMDDFLKSLKALRDSLVGLQANTDILLRNAPREEVKKTFRDKSLEELEASLDYYTKHQNYEICQAIKEVIDEKQSSSNIAE